MQGYIKLHRELIEKPIWNCSTPEQKVILITLLLMASHRENEWVFEGKKYKVQPGQFVTSIKKIAEKAGVTSKNVRTALKKFENLEFMANKSTNKNRLITIVNWGIYQGEGSATGKQTGKQSASTGQAVGKQPGNYQEVKNDKECKNEKKKIKQNHSGDSSPHGEIINYFCMAYKKKYDIDYVFAKGKDGAIISNLLKAYDIDFMKEFINWFFETTDPFISQNRNIGILQASKDKFIARRKNNKDWRQ